MVWTKKQQKEYTKKHLKKIMKRTTEWRKKNPKRFKELMRKNRIKHRKEITARNLARKIKIPKDYLCEVCDKSLATNRHHKDYNKPFLVDLVCKKCHIKLDKKRKVKI